jgi:hypothetical protein
LFFALEDDAVGASSTTYVGGADMADGIRWVGLDVHVRQSTVAVFDQAGGEVFTRRVTGRPHELLPVLREIPRPARMVYEAGPTGYGLARRALAEGIEFAVCAPGKTERPPADRVKTDSRDAIRLARLLASGELTRVTIPSVEREQLRDLVRCREDIRADLMRARHRIGGFLLRREIYWAGPQTRQRAVSAGAWFLGGSKTGGCVDGWSRKWTCVDELQRGRQNQTEARTPDRERGVRCLASRTGKIAEAVLSSDPLSSGRRLTSPSYCSLAWRRLGHSERSTR